MRRAEKKIDSTDAMLCYVCVCVRKRHKRNKKKSKNLFYVVKSRPYFSLLLLLLPPSSLLLLLMLLLVIYKFFLSIDSNYTAAAVFFFRFFFLFFSFFLTCPISPSLLAFAQPNCYIVCAVKIEQHYLRNKESVHTKCTNREAINEYNDVWRVFISYQNQNRCKVFPEKIFETHSLYVSLVVYTNNKRENTRYKKKSIFIISYINLINLMSGHFCIWGAFGTLYNTLAVSRLILISSIIQTRKKNAAFTGMQYLGSYKTPSLHKK